MATKKKKQEEFISLSDLGYLCMYHWVWFAISFLLCMGGAAAYLLITPKTFVREVSVLIKEEGGKNSDAEFGEEFKELGLELKTTNLKNEVREIKSRDVLTEVARRLNLNIVYYARKSFKVLTPFTEELPFELSFTPSDEKKQSSFDLFIESPEQYVLSNFSNATVGSEPITVKLDGSSVQTPIGVMSFKKSDYFEFRTVVHQKYQIVNRPINEAVDEIKNRLKTSIPDKESTIIDLKYTEQNILRADAVLRTIAEVYSDFGVEDQKQLIRAASAFIVDRLQIIEKELNAIDTDISQFKSTNAITDVNTAGSLYISQFSRSDDQILSLNNELSVAQYILDILNTKSKSHELLPVNSGITNTSIQSQIQDYNTQLLSLKSHLRYTSAQNPLIENMEQQLKGVRESVIQSLRNEINTISLKLDTYEQYGNKATEKIESNPDQAKYLMSIERQQKIKEELYMYLLQKKEKIDLSESYVARNRQMLDNPHASLTPVSPNNKNIILSALALALLIPLGLVFTKNAMNGSIRGSKDLDGVISVPVLGDIPFYSEDADPLVPRLLNEKPKITKVARRNILVKENGHDLLNESFRLLRTNLEFMTQSQHTEGGSVIISASYNPNSGKTFVSANLAAAFSIRNHKTLVIDGDLRHTSASSYVNRPTIGIANYLGGQIGDIHEAIVGLEQYPNLFFLPVGVRPPNPTELLSSDRFKELIAQLRTEFEYIFIDCPPASYMADTRIIERLADRTLFVLRVGLFKREMLGTLEEEFQKGAFKNMAVIVNGSALDNRYGNQYAYGYYDRYNFAYLSNS